MESSSPWLEHIIVVFIYKFAINHIWSSRLQVYSTCDYSKEPGKDTNAMKSPGCSCVCDMDER
jgi:hypothetical protein